MSNQQQAVVVNQIQAQQVALVAQPVIQVPNLIILYETPLNNDELQCLYSVLSPKLICEVDAKLKSSSYKELCSQYTCLLIDVRDTDLKNWCIDQSIYLYQNSETIQGIYKHKSGKHISAEEALELKKAFGVQTVKKYLPTYSKIYTDYLTKSKPDHQKHDIVNLNILEKIYYFAISCFGRKF